ncbi:hypothetical protein GCM10010398_47010 [Streptomyces fimbriatus]
MAGGRLARRTELGPHTRMGVSFHVPRGGTARVGLSGATPKGEPLLTRCMAPAADRAVTDGRHSLREARWGPRVRQRGGPPSPPGGRRPAPPAGCPTSA